MPEPFIGLSRALELTAERTPLLPPRPRPLSRAAGLVCAQVARARVSSPSVTASTKDGFAVRGADLAGASPENPTRLVLAGFLAAGEKANGRLEPGQAMAVTTGAPLPPGADAVLASEFAHREEDWVVCLADAEPGRNVAAKGCDVAPGQVLAEPGMRLDPATLGLMAAGGCSQVEVYPRPKAGLLATGREVVAPGHPLPQGSVYASNLVALGSWLDLHGLAAGSRVVDDDEAQIAEAAQDLLQEGDALLTSGGAWTSRRDLVVGVLRDLGMELIFRRVRMGPGKGVAFGLLQGKPVFCLPGGPPSNEMAFLQIALPGLLRMAGRPAPGLARAPARLARDLRGQSDWTQFWHGRLEPAAEGPPVFHAFETSGRLSAMARSQAIVCLPEGQSRIPAGETVMVQVLGTAFGEA